MLVDFDPAKNERNIASRGLPFERAEVFDFEAAVTREDIRMDYPERRLVALGFLDQRLHALCFTPIDGGIRVISFCKANTSQSEPQGWRGQHASRVLKSKTACAALAPGVKKPARDHISI